MTSENNKSGLTRVVRIQLVTLVFTSLFSARNVSLRCSTCNPDDGSGAAQDCKDQCLVLHPERGH